MQRLQEEIYRYSEHFRAWQDQDSLSEVQREEGQTEHLRLYDQDQPEKLNVTPGRSPQTGPDRTRRAPSAVGNTSGKGGRGASRQAGPALHDQSRQSNSLPVIRPCRPSGMTIHLWSGIKHAFKHGMSRLFPGDSTCSSSYHSWFCKAVSCGPDLRNPDIPSDNAQE
jgi:hypothetical protein